MGELFFRVFTHELTLKGVISIKRFKFNGTMVAFIPETQWCW